MNSMTKSKFLQDPKVEELRNKLACHELYERLKDMQALRVFMERHVFAVWDFMSIVKSLQRELTCIGVPWVPPSDADAARLVNDIVLGEETDVRPDGTFASHYQLYIDAMEEAGADTSGIRRFVTLVSGGNPVAEALDLANVPVPARKFVNETFETIEGTPLHVRAAALFYGREDLLPDMFKPMVESLRDAGEPCGKFVYYLERHIEVDRDEHAEMAQGILNRLCGAYEEREKEARRTAVNVLTSRLTFWDRILEAVHADCAGRSCR